LKKVLIVLLFFAVTLCLSSCFVLETFFPPIGENQAKVSVYLNYYSIDIENRNIKSVEIPVKNISFNGNTVENIGNVTLNLRCDQQFKDFASFFGYFSSLAKFTFPADTTIINPSLTLSIDSPITVTYLEDELGSTHATTVNFEVPANKRNIEMKVKTLTSSLGDVRELDLPEGQSEMIVLLNLDGIIPLNEMVENPSLPNGFDKSFSMLTDDLCIINGKLVDTNTEPVIHVGEGFTLNLKSNFYLGDTEFNYLSYPIFSDSENRYYYMLIPQQTNSGYNSTIKVNIPDKPLKDVSKSITVPYDKQSLEVNFEFTSGD